MNIEKVSLLVALCTLTVTAVAIACTAADTAGQPVTGTPEGSARDALSRPAAARHASGEVGLTSVVPGQHATFIMNVLDQSACGGMVSYTDGRVDAGTPLARLPVGATGALSWTWPVPNDVPPKGGHVRIQCDDFSFRIPFGIGGPAIGTLAIPDPPSAP